MKGNANFQLVPLNIINYSLSGKDMEKLILSLYIETWAHLIYKAITQQIVSKCGACSYKSCGNCIRNGYDFVVYTTTEKLMWAFENIKMTEVMALFISTLETKSQITAYDLMHWIHYDLQWEINSFQFLQNNKKMLLQKLIEEYKDRKQRHNLNQSHTNKTLKQGGSTKNKKKQRKRYILDIIDNDLLMEYQ